MKDNKALEEQLLLDVQTVLMADADCGQEVFDAKDRLQDFIKQALTKEVSKDTNVEEVEEAFEDLRYGDEDMQDKAEKTIRNYIEQHSFNVSKENDNQFLDNFKRTGTKIICNEDGSVDVEEPTKSAKEYSVSEKDFLFLKDIKNCLNVEKIETEIYDVKNMVAQILKLKELEK